MKVLFLWIKHLMQFQLQVINLCMVPEPLVEERNKLLKEIATQFHIQWNPPMALKFGCDCGCDCASCGCCK